MKKQFVLALCALLINAAPIMAQAKEYPDLTPTELSFQRLAVRRFIFSNNIPLNEFVPSQIVAFESMHPAFALSDDDTPKPDQNFKPIIENGKLVLSAESGSKEASIYMGGVNPYATYEVDIESYSPGEAQPEIGLEIARMGLRDRIQVIARLSDQDGGIFLRLYKNGDMTRKSKVVFITRCQHRGEKAWKMGLFGLKGRI